MVVMSSPLKGRKADRMPCPACKRDISVTATIRSHYRLNSKGYNTGSKCEGSHKPRDWKPIVLDIKPAEEDSYVEDQEPLIIMTVTEHGCEKVIDAQTQVYDDRYCPNQARWQIEGTGGHSMMGGPLRNACDEHFVALCEEILAIPGRRRNSPPDEHVCAARSR